MTQQVENKGILSHSMRGRYAPSPTGPLHMGNLRTALAAWLHTRLHSGRFILRMEDLDTPRNRSGCAEQIIEDLRWLGLDWDEGPDVGGDHGPYIQSERLEIYEQTFAELKNTGIIYPCYCSRRQVQGVYPGTCRGGGRETVKPPSWRINVQAQSDVICFQDLVLDRTCRHVRQQIGDFIIKRADGIFAYQLAVAVDDLAMQISHVVRGEDLLDCTARQLLIMKQLRAETVPDYGHAPLVLDEDGKKLSKRLNACGLAPLREKKISAEQVVGQLAASLCLIPKATPISTVELLSRIQPGQLVSNIKKSASFLPTI